MLQKLVPSGGATMPFGIEFKCALLGATAWYRQLGSAGRARAQKTLGQLKERVDAKMSAIGISGILLAIEEVPALAEAQ